MTNFIQKIFFVIIVSFCLVACNKQPNKDEITLLSNVIDSKIEAAHQILKFDGINAAIDYCENVDEVTTNAGVFLINCSIAANFYKPEDKIQISDNEVILPVSLYAQVKNVIHLLDEGWKFRDVAISAFARKKDDGVFSDPIIWESKEL